MATQYTYTCANRWTQTHTSRYQSTGWYLGCYKTYPMPRHELVIYLISPVVLFTYHHLTKTPWQKKPDIRSLRNLEWTTYLEQMAATDGHLENWYNSWRFLASSTVKHWLVITCWLLCFQCPAVDVTNQASAVPVYAWNQGKDAPRVCRPDGATVKITWSEMQLWVPKPMIKRMSHALMKSQPQATWHLAHVKRRSPYQKPQKTVSQMSFYQIRKA